MPLDGTEAGHGSDHEVRVAESEKPPPPRPGVRSRRRADRDPVPDVRQRSPAPWAPAQALLLLEDSPLGGRDQHQGIAEEHRAHHPAGEALFLTEHVHGDDGGRPAGQPGGEAAEEHRRVLRHREHDVRALVGEATHEARQRGRVVAAVPPEHLERHAALRDLAPQRAGLAQAQHLGTEGAPVQSRQHLQRQDLGPSRAHPVAEQADPDAAVRPRPRAPAWNRGRSARPTLPAMPAWRRREGGSAARGEPRAGAGRPAARSGPAAGGGGRPSPAGPQRPGPARCRVQRGGLRIPPGHQLRHEPRAGSARDPGGVRDLRDGHDHHRARRLARRLGHVGGAHPAT